MNDHSTEVVPRIAASTRQVRRPGSVKRSSSMGLKENRNIACLTPIAFRDLPGLPARAGTLRAANLAC